MNEKIFTTTAMTGYFLGTFLGGALLQSLTWLTGPVTIISLLYLGYLLWSHENRN